MLGGPDFKSGKGRVTVLGGFDFQFSPANLPFPEIGCAMMVQQHSAFLFGRMRSDELTGQSLDSKTAINGGFSLS